MLEALKKQYEAEIEIGMANLKVYMTNPAGIGEHSDIAEAMDKQISSIATASDKVKIVNHILSDQ